MCIRDSPGAEAIIIKPIAISGDILKIIINKYAVIGRIINCETKPKKKSFGDFNTLVKSSTFNPKPKPNIINASMIGAIFVTISIFYEIVRRLRTFLINLALFLKINFWYGSTL